MMRTNGIERMRWAKDLIFEKTSGLQELAVGSLHGELRCNGFCGHEKRLV